jgi:hypothetical protein
LDSGFSSSISRWTQRAPAFQTGQVGDNRRTRRMFPSSWLNNVPSSLTSCKSVREPDERCVGTCPLQLTAKKATTIKKATANVLIPIPYLMLLSHFRYYGRLPEPVRRGSDHRWSRAST